MFTYCCKRVPGSKWVVLLIVCVVVVGLVVVVFVVARFGYKCQHSKHQAALSQADLRSQGPPSRLNSETGPQCLSA